MSSRSGPRTASPFLGTPLGSALRLHRANLFWWAVSLAVLDATYGAFAGDVEEAIGDNETTREWVATPRAATSPSTSSE
jgi:ABC-2 type transport system permease protein